MLYRKNALPYHRFAWAFYVRGKARAVRRNRFKRWAREWMQQKTRKMRVGMDILCGTTKVKKGPAAGSVKNELSYETFCKKLERLFSCIKT